MRCYLETTDGHDVHMNLVYLGPGTVCVHVCTCVCVCVHVCVHVCLLLKIDIEHLHFNRGIIDMSSSGSRKSLNLVFEYVFIIRLS